MTNNNFSQTAAFIWSVADLLRGGFKQSQYGNIILPFTLLRRLECVLEENKDTVLVEAERVKVMNLPEEAQEKMILRATNGLAFFNTSPMDLGKMGQKDIKANLEKYIQCFSADVREIFEHFKFDEFVGLLDGTHLLYKIVKEFATTDLSPKAISNHDMGLVFEELIRRFAESSNETAGEHFTPRDIVRLTTSLVFMEDDDVLTKEGIIRTIYDPTAGTGGFLSSGMEYVRELNPKAEMRVFSQELNPDSYAICKANLLIKGQDVSCIKLGNTLSNDQLPFDKFDYMLSNPPFGADWKKIESEIKTEHEVKGFDGRFGAGLPRVSDATLLFVLHAISKLREQSLGGGRVGIIVSGSCLFNGDAGSGESEIRRYILEADLLEAIISLPEGMFYNTSVQPYILLLSNNKTHIRKNKVQLIDGSEFGLSLRKRLGMKNVYLDDDSIKELINKYSRFELMDDCKIVNVNDLMYRQIKVGLNSREFEYERVPINVDVNSFLTDALGDVCEGYEINRQYVDHKDGEVGKLGAEFSFDLFRSEKNNKGHQFRFFFKENNERWDIAISKRWRKVVFSGQNELDSVDRSKYYFFSFNVDFDIDYLKYFFKSERWSQWLVTYRSNGVSNAPQKYSTLRKFIHFPNLKEQREIASILDESLKWKQKLTTLEMDLWREDKSDYSFERYRLPVDKDLHSRMVEFAPYPFANIMHHYESISEFDYKARYELLLKLFECLAVFSVSVALGFIEKESQTSTSINILKSQKRFIKNATFGTWVTLLEKIKNEAATLPSKTLVIDVIFDEKLSGLFENALNIRNDTSGHGSYPTKSAARDIFRKVDDLYLGFLDMFYEVFANYCLVRPISGVWNGKLHTYELEEYSGLGCYPFGLAKMSSKTPFVDDELYFISSKNSEDKIRIFPFVRLIDLEEDSGLEAFYFYSKTLTDSDSDNDYNFVYISHQQIHKQKQLHKNIILEEIYS